jgi:ribosome-binding protein aMBF1 (putative translation factor)
VFEQEFALRSNCSRKAGGTVKHEWKYPGDDVVLKSVGRILQKARESQGISLEDAAKKYTEAMKERDPKIGRRAVALTLKNAREEAGMSRQQLTRKSGVPLRRIILVERALVDVQFTEWVRIAYAVHIKPSKLAEEQERIEKNLLDAKW